MTSTSIQELQGSNSSQLEAYLNVLPKEKKQKKQNHIDDIVRYETAVNALCNTPVRKTSFGFHLSWTKTLLKLKNIPTNCKIIALTEGVLVHTQEWIALIHYKKFEFDRVYQFDKKYNVVQWCYSWDSIDNFCMKGYDINGKVVHKHIAISENNHNCIWVFDISAENVDEMCYDTHLPEAILVLKKPLECNTDTYTVASSQPSSSSKTSTTHKKKNTKREYYYCVSYHETWPTSINFIECFDWPEKDENVRLVGVKSMLEKNTKSAPMRSKRRNTQQTIIREKRQKLHIN